MVRTMLEHPELRAVVWWKLATREAHDLYRRFGFIDVPQGRYMMLVKDGGQT